MAKDIIPRTAFVIDDDFSLRREISSFMGKNGYDVKAYSSGNDAMRAIRDETHYDVLITDLAMRDIPGDKIAEASKQVKPWTPVIVISESGRYSSKHASAKPANADALVAKYMMPEGRKTFRGRDLKGILHNLGILDDVFWKDFQEE